MSLAWGGVVAGLVVALAWLNVPALLRRLVHRGLGGYRHRAVEPDPSLPAQLPADESKRVAVVGGGLAGMSSAIALAERGYEVTLFEADTHLGGKIGGWREEVDGQAFDIDHGFHAFFHHYYNLNDFLRRLGIDRSMTTIEDYLIMERNGRSWRFKDVEPSPVLNLAALGFAGLYRFRDIMLTRGRDEMGVFMEYDRDVTFELMDDVSYATFAEQAELPRSLKLVFNTFARAFFSFEDQLSMAELIKSFHFYYLSHDRGLLYDYPEGSYREAVLAPIEAHMRSLGVDVRVGTPVKTLTPREGEGFLVNDERFDRAVLATTSKGASAISKASPTLADHAPELAHGLRRLASGNRYAVLRVWMDAPLRTDVPVFVSTERDRVLDSVTALHRITDEARAWAAEHGRDERGGSILELHCYAVPNDVDDDRVAEAFLGELRAMFGELSDARVVHQHLQLKDDFTSFHTGQHRERPATETELEGLVLAGDWVRLPIPVMLLEAAYSSGLYAANAICALDGVRGHAVDTVPTRGLLADLHERRRRLRSRWSTTPAAGELRPSA